MQNFIGPFQFQTLIGPPAAIKPEIEIVARQGVRGVAAWRLDARGRPFGLHSAVDARDKQHARSLFLQYKELIGADPVQAVWSGLIIAAEDRMTEWLVLDVTCTEIRELLGSSGAIHPPGLGWIECDWVIVPVDG